jgi:hypothetical protein
VICFSRRCVGVASCWVILAAHTYKHIQTHKNTHHTPPIIHTQTQTPTNTQTRTHITDHTHTHTNTNTPHTPLTQTHTQHTAQHYTHTHTHTHTHKHTQNNPTRSDTNTPPGNNTHSWQSALLAISSYQHFMDSRGYLPRAGTRSPRDYIQVTAQQLVWVTMPEDGRVRPKRVAEECT